MSSYIRNLTARHAGSPIPAPRSRHRAESAAAGRTRPAFTLTELMISIALALILVVGVTVIFRTTSETISAGQAISTANRGEQSLHNVFADDMRSIVLPEQAPFLIIRSRREAGFTDQADMLTDLDYAATQTNPDVVDQQIRTWDPDGDGTEGQTAAGIYNLRNHRVDRIGFFARGQFKRQTGSSRIVDDMTAREAFIWYGHVTQPDPETLAGSPVFLGLGAAYEGVKRARTFPQDPTEPLTANTNPLNFFVRDWTLGRSVILLARGEDTDAAGGPDVITGTNETVNEGFLKRYDPEVDFPNFAPLSITSRTTEGSGGGPFLFFSRYDLAAMTMDQYRWIVAHNALNDIDWWWPHRNYFDYRFQYSPLFARPLDAESASRTVPALLRGCSQFIVEFAGDFVTQDATGAVTEPVPDGTTDFIQDNVGNRIIRWYGMPRDSNGDGSIRGQPGGFTGAQDNANDMVDVLPVALVALTNPSSLPLPDGWFEQISPGMTATAELRDLPADTTYVAAWGPHSVGLGKPRMLRFIVGTAPSTDAGQERIAEFVFTVR